MFLLVTPEVTSHQQDSFYEYIAREAGHWLLQQATKSHRRCAFFQSRG